MNIWQIGKIMYTFITRGRSFKAYTDYVPNFYADLDDGQPFTRTMGSGLLDAPYSKTPRQSVLRCLAYLPSRRPVPRDLVVIISGALVACKQVGTGDGIGSGFEAGILDYPEPQHGQD